jgi:DAACS family dicarboxylate/amino acid:cation (Na+ or H+) symporter
MSDSSASSPIQPPSGRPWILLASLLAGVLLGGLAHPFRETPWVTSINDWVLYPAGQVFLRLIFMVVVPLVFSALVLGTLELARGAGVGKIAGRTLLYTLIASSASVLVGIGLVSWIRPGEGFSHPDALLSAKSAEIGTIQTNAQKAKPLVQSLLDLLPKNPLESAVNALQGEMIALMVFALLFGLAFAATRRDRTEDAPSTLEKFLEEILAVSMKIVGYAMKLAPVAVFAMIFQSVSKLGFSVLGKLGLYAGTVILGLLVQQFVVYAFLLRTVARRNPWAFFSACRETYLYAFSTASSNATLPQALETAEKRLGIPPQVARFVLTVGASANQNGTALFEGVTVLFLAQVYGISLGIGQQFQVVALSILAGIGTAGVPGGSLPLIVILLQNVGIPAEGIGLILGVDRFLDMCRTTLNVSGDLVIAGLVSPAFPEGTPAKNA